MIQAAKQLEWLTGGDIEAGFHEVIVTDSTIKAIESAKKANKSLWRVSSTLFCQIKMTQTLEPLYQFCTTDN